MPSFLWECLCDGGSNRIRGLPRPRAARPFSQPPLSGLLGGYGRAIFYEGEHAAIEGSNLLAACVGCFLFVVSLMPIT